MQSNSTTSNFTVQSGRPEGLHVAIIMDGNGRWATRRGLPRVEGHRAGVAAVRRAVESAAELGIGCMTLYAFSCDNWRRPADEVESIFWLLRAYLRLECERLRENGVRLEVIGRRDRLPHGLRREIERAEHATRHGRVLHLRVAIDYSSRDAIARAAVRALRGLSADDDLAEGRLRRLLGSTLVGDGGDVDLLIRTGGEKRLSDFLLWESAYAELHFTDRMWPEFDATDLERAVRDFGGRERRFGAVPAVVAPVQVAGGAR